MTGKDENTENKTLLVLAAAAAIALIVISIFAAFSLLRSLDILPDKATVIPEPSQELAPTVEPEQESRVPVSIDDDPVKGSRYAPVTIVEFGDFQCSYCATFTRETLPLIEKEYVSTGEVRIVFRDYPLRNHRFAKKAAQAAECADEQGKFWQYHDLLFENQHALDAVSLRRYARDLELDPASFAECLNSRETAAEVERDIRDGQIYGVRGTPTFFIDGTRLAGAKPYEVFQRIIEQRLRQ